VYRLTSRRQTVGFKRWLLGASLSDAIRNERATTQTNPFQANPEGRWRFDRFSVRRPPDSLCSGGAEEFSLGFQPWETSNKTVRPERARDGVGEMPFECYRKGIGHFFGRRYNFPLSNNAHRHKVERWRAPIEIFFSRLLLIKQ
jgi:hypothetical protein